MKSRLLCAAMVAATLMSPPLIFAAETTSSTDATMIQVARPSEEYSGWSYQDVVAEFEAAGFTNIVLVPDGDLNVATQVFTHDGTIESVTVGESTGFTREATFASDAKVVIKYHTFPDTANQINYDAAKALYDAGEYEQAKEAFEALGDYSDSKDMALSCQEELSAEETKASEPNAVLITVPNSSSELEGQKYWKVQDALKKAGFTNIKLNPIGDMKIGVSGDTENKVTSVTVNGSEFTSTASYTADTEFVISFRTFEDKINSGMFESGEAADQAAEDTTRKAFDTEVETYKSNNDYTEFNKVESGDLQYGWTMGEFSVTGFTSTTKDDDGTTVVLKNVGDTVSLWFTLDQNIDHLYSDNTDKTITVSKDTDGSCTAMGLDKSDDGQGRGTLLIRKTNYQGEVEKTVTYTNYLAGCSIGAVTNIDAYEEGDYEVVLLYELCVDTKRVGNFSILPTYENYYTTFKFKVRNANCMVYPFDLETGSELADGDYTMAGFKLDLANSRYLSISITRATLKEGFEGPVEDIRLNTAAKDGDEFTEPGIYRFTVSNKYTGEQTTKSIYVGDPDDPESVIDASKKNTESSDDKK